MLSDFVLLFFLFLSFFCSVLLLFDSNATSFVMKYFTTPHRMIEVKTQNQKVEQEARERASGTICTNFTIMVGDFVMRITHSLISWNCTSVCDG